MTIYIAAEFRGLARDFRRQVETAERTYGDQWIAKVLTPLRLRLARKPTLRKEAVADIARTLELMANPYRISSNVEVVKRGHLRITQMVVGTSKDREDSWQDNNWESTTAILRIVLTTEGGVDVQTAPIVTVSQHAVARWFERTGTRDQSKLLTDIAMILDAQEPDYAFASNGVWLGPVTKAYVDIQGESETRRRKMVIRNVRTYVSADQIDTRIPIDLAVAQ